MAGVQLGGAGQRRERARGGLRRLPPRDAPVLHRRGQHAREPEARAARAAGRALRARRHDHGRGHRRAAARRERRNACAGRASCAATRARGRHAVRGIAMPVLHDALDRSFQLAAAMDSRGYGRSGAVPRPRPPHRPPRCCSPGCSACASAPTACSTRRRRGSSARPMLALGLALCGRRARRSAAGASTARSYRPDPWAFPEWSTALVGRGRRGRDDRRRRARRVRAQPVDVPARVADAPAAPGARRSCARSLPGRRSRRRRRVAARRARRAPSRAAAAPQPVGAPA